MRRALLAVALFAAAGTPLAEQLPSTGNLLERYAKGDFAAFTPPRTSNDLDRFRQALEHDAEPWLERGDARNARRRHLVVASIALEAARASLDVDWSHGRRYIEFAAALLRRAPPDDGERLWHLAAVSLMQGAYDNELLLQQQKLTWPRFSEEPRFLLALAVVLESSTWPDPDRAEEWHDNDAELKEAAERNTLRRSARQPPDRELRDQALEYERRLRMRQAIEALEDLSNAESIRAEALLRLGYLHLRLRRVEVAIEQFDEVLDITEEPFLAYLAHFLRGTGEEQAGDRANAAESYRAALQLAPRAQSASLALASLLFLGDERDEAAQLIDSAIAMPLADDPWRAYQSGDYRFWNERLAALREALR
jgi:tetratricopeptide (TPR) repeat protein